MAQYNDEDENMKVAEDGQVPDNWWMREKLNNLERQVAALTTELQKRDKHIESLTEQLRAHFNVIRDLASALTVR